MIYYDYDCFYDYDHDYDYNYDYGYEIRCGYLWSADICGSKWYAT